MKLLIVILYCVFCKHSYCSAHPTWLTNDEIIEFFGTNDSVPTYGIAEIRIPDRRVKRDADDTFRISIPFTDRTTRHLNLKRTEGILANGNTPVWHAQRAKNSANISYTRHTDLTRFGRFDFYQDFPQKAAVVIFYDQSKLIGYLENYRFERSLNSQTQEANSANRYVLVPQQQSSNIPTLGIPMDNRVKRATGDQARLNNQPLPKTVYPQLLIQAERVYVEHDILKALEFMLVYWNSVDMLYSNLENPRIKLNIAGFIAPMDDFTTPWVTKAQDPDYNAIIDYKTALKELGKHFSDYSHVFPSDQYDFMISHVQKAIDPTMRMLGVAFRDVDCNNKAERVVLLSDRIMLTPKIAAHEIGHLFSVRHDQETTRCVRSGGIMSNVTTTDSQNFEWSVCSKDFIQEYFGKSKSVCLDNFPETEQQCGNSMQE